MSDRRETEKLRRRVENSRRRGGYPITLELNEAELLLREIDRSENEEQSDIIEINIKGEPF